MKDVANIVLYYAIGFAKKAQKYNPSVQKKKLEAQWAGRARVAHFSFCFRFIWLNSFREDFEKSTNRNQELPVAVMLVNGSGRNEQSL